MSIQRPSKAYASASILALCTGVVAFAIGLYNADMELNEKGYYVITLLYGLFSTVSLQKTVRDKEENIKTSSVYVTLSWVSTGCAIGLLIVGLINAELALSEKGFYAMAFVLSLFSAVTVQKNVRDGEAKEETSNESYEVSSQ